MYNATLPKYWLPFLIALAAIIALPMILLCVIRPKPPKSAAELVGRYVLDSPLIRDDLILSPDGTFKQTITVKATGRVLSASGPWKYPLSDQYNDLVLDGRLVILERPDKLIDISSDLPRGRSLLFARYQFGRLYVGGGADDWPSYERISDN